VKLCVFSRPEAVCESKLKTLSHLKVQDLTSNDIRRYVEKSFANIDLSLVISKDTVQSLVQTIIQKAEGVFLWVCIVVDYVCSDTDSYSTPDKVLQRVEKLPPVLDQMHETMWNRYNADDDLYRAETAMYLNMLPDPRPKSLLLFFLASHQDFQKALLEGGQSIKVPELVQQVCLFGARLNARCCGLVSSRPRLSNHAPEPDEHMIDPSGGLADAMWTSLDIMHCIARDFLENTPEGRKILSYDTLSWIEHGAQRITSHLCIGLIDSSPTDYCRAIWETVDWEKDKDIHLVSQVCDLALAVSLRRPE
jgi:hypothetical protein